MKTSEIKGTQIEKRVECPMCNSFFTISYFRPETRTPSISYSDGQTDVTNILDPMPTTHCIFCGFSFSVPLNTHKESETECVINTNNQNKQDETELSEEILKGYLNSVRFKRAIIPQEEFFLRKHIWWLLNNDKEASDALFREYKDVWQENLKEIITIIDYIPLNEPFLKAEALRNLGLFEQCLKFLDHLPADSDSIFVSRLRRECEAGNPYRVIV